MTKYCKDCCWFREIRNIPPLPGGPKCGNPVSAISTDLVYGNTSFTPCSIMRVDLCGPEAKLFEPKDAK